jgi:hypothetical protein
MTKNILQPQEIHDKSVRKYPEFLEEWFNGKDIFPWSIPCKTSSLSGFDPAELKRQIQLLIEGAKDIRGYGYEIVWETRNSRTFGKNNFPKTVEFKTREDFLRLIKKAEDFRFIEYSVERVLSSLPELRYWLRDHLCELPKLSEDIDGLLEVVRYFIANPKPDCYIREIPVGFDTKFIERHSKTLSEWLDILLPANAINVEEKEFELRFGLRYEEQMFTVRLLDPSLKDEMRFPCSMVALPLHAFVRLAPSNVNVLIVENRMTLLTVPHLQRTLVIGGLGKGVLALKNADWIQRLPTFYWGDIDVEGFEILSSFREVFPNVKSLLMDLKTLQRFSHFSVQGNRKICDPPLFLDADEREAFVYCRDNNFRLEQERIPTCMLLTLINQMSQS